MQTTNIWYVFVFRKGCGELVSKAWLNPPPDLHYDIQWVHVSIQNYIRRTRLSILGNPAWEAKQTGLDTPSRKCETFRQSALLMVICHSLNLPATRLHKDNPFKTSHSSLWNSDANERHSGRQLWSSFIGPCQSKISLRFTNSVNHKTR